MTVYYNNYSILCYAILYYTNTILILDYTSARGVLRVQHAGEVDAVLADARLRVHGDELLVGRRLGRRERIRTLENIVFWGATWVPFKTYII